MVDRFTPTYVISTYHCYCCEFDSSIVQKGY